MVNFEYNLGTQQCYGISVNITSGDNTVTRAVLSLLLLKLWKFWKWTGRPLDSLSSYSILYNFLGVFSLLLNCKASSSTVPGTVQTGKCKSHTTNHSLSTVSILVRTWEWPGALGAPASTYWACMWQQDGISIPNTYLPPFFYQTRPQTVTEMLLSPCSITCRTSPSYWKTSLRYGAFTCASLRGCFTENSRKCYLLVFCINIVSFCLDM